MVGSWGWVSCLAYASTLFLKQLTEVNTLVVVSCCIAECTLGSCLLPLCTDAVPVWDHMRCCRVQWDSAQLHPELYHMVQPGRWLEPVWVDSCWPAFVTINHVLQLPADMQRPLLVVAYMASLAFVVCNQRVEGCTQRD